MLPGEVDGRRFLRAMARFGWEPSRTRGSHHILRKGQSGPILVIAFHKTMSRNSIRRALREAGIDEAAFEAEL
ncbi:MAG: type II toxin-antitoxin system HicA family toxin [Thermoplasmatota archaeon]